MKLKLFFIAVSFFSIKTSSQIAISNTAEMAKIKLGTTFFAMKDPASPKAIAYIDAIKKNWTLSKVECIKYTDVEKNIAPNNSFVTIGANMTSTNASATSETDFNLEFWTTNGKFVYDPKKRKHFNQDEKIVVASVNLFPDFYLQNNPSTLYKIDYDAAGHLKNWSAAILGNYIQQVVYLLNKSEERQAKTEFLNKNELGKIGTLYIPDYVLTKFSKNSDDESRKQDTKEIVEGSGLNCSFLSTEELNDKISDSPTPFYYLLLIKTNSSKSVTVTQSQSGEIVYSANSSTGNFKASDLKDLQKAIQKK
ncbi:hypothetical protein [Flavobacterium wongokense]|uniref:hypothetical protein n=1 Tax=Flavobacterium wongokense TaxID=2910674 RepID=UPI001F33C57D|nr:hypothetical protein [Flavobacterium sp. WG47]MCF6131648.1 hypothetical protein [Flavobacterium sp. WG47]